MESVDQTLKSGEVPDHLEDPKNSQNPYLNRDFKTILIGENTDQTNHVASLVDHLHALKSWLIVLTFPNQLFQKRPDRREDMKNGIIATRSIMFILSFRKLGKIFGKYRRF